MKLTARRVLLNTASGDRRIEATPATAVLGDRTLFIAAALGHSEHLSEIDNWTSVVRCWHLTNDLKILGIRDITYNQRDLRGLYAACVGGNKVVLLQSKTYFDYGNETDYQTSLSYTVDCSGAEPEIGSRWENNPFYYDIPGFTHHFYHEPTDRLFVIATKGADRGNDETDELNGINIPYLLVFKGSTAQLLSGAMARIPEPNEVGVGGNAYGLSSTKAFGISVSESDPTEVVIEYEAVYYSIDA